MTLSSKANALQRRLLLSTQYDILSTVRMICRPASTILQRLLGTGKKIFPQRVDPRIASYRLTTALLFFLFGIALLSIKENRIAISDVIQFQVPDQLNFTIAGIAFLLFLLYLVLFLLGMYNENLADKIETSLITLPYYLGGVYLTILYLAEVSVFLLGMLKGVTTMPYSGLHMPLLVTGLFLIAFIIWMHFIRVRSIRVRKVIGKANGTREVSWLRQAVIAEIQRRSIVTWREKIRRLTSPKPSFVVGIVLLLLASLIISWLLFQWTPHLFVMDSESHLRDAYTTMWQVQIAIAAIALPLLLFVIEFSRDVKLAPARSPDVLIRETWVFPIIVFSLAGTVRLGVDTSWFLSEPVFIVDFVFVFMTTVGLTLFAYASALLLLLSPSRMKQKALQVVREKMSEHLDASIETRLANNLLSQKLEELKVGLWPFSSDRRDEERYLTLETSRYGTVTNINLQGLAEFVAGLPWKRVPGVVLSSDAELEPSAADYRLSQTSIWLMKRYGDVNTGSNNGLIRIDKAAFDALDPIILRTQLERVIEIKENARGPSEDLRLELNYLLDNLKDSIKDNKTRTVEDSLETYEELVLAFIDKLHQWESPYDKKRTKGEASSLRGGWSEIDWIRDDLPEIIDSSLNTQNRHVIHRIFGFIISPAYRAFNKGEYFIFHRFVNWIPYCYVSSLQQRLDSEVASLIVELSWRLPKELVNLYMMSNIKQVSTEEEVAKKAEFVEGVILVFNQLLRDAYKRGRLQDFNQFASALNSLFEDYTSSSYESEAQEIEWRLGRDGLDASARSELEHKLKLIRMHAQCAKGLSEYRKTALYGIKAWILRNFDVGKLSADDLKPWFESIGSPTTLKESWQLLERATQAEADHEFGWLLWESEEHPEGAVFALGFNRYLQTLFLVHCLQLMRDMDPAKREESPIPPSKRLIFLAEQADSPFQQMLTHMNQEASKWKPVTGDKGMAAIPLLRKALEEAVEKQKQEDVDFLKKAPLSGQKIDQFAKEVLQARAGAAKFRPIIQKYGNYEFISTPSEAATLFGFNTLDRKDVYVEDSGVESSGWGAHYGRELANGEDKTMKETLVSSLQPLTSEHIIPNAVVSTLDKAIKSLSSIAYSPIVLIFDSWPVLEMIQASEEFRATTERELGSSLLGHYRGKPVFNLPGFGDPMVGVVDIKALGKWRQFKPKQVLEEERYIGNEELTVCVKLITEDYAAKLIDTYPKLKQDKDGNQRPDDQAKNELRQKVHLRLGEQFEFEVLDKNAGYMIIVAG